MKRKFNVGDLVIVNVIDFVDRRFGIKIGMIGTIVDIDDEDSVGGEQAYGIKFDHHESPCLIYETQISEV